MKYYSFIYFFYVKFKQLFENNQIKTYGWKLSQLVISLFSFHFIFY